MWTPIKNDAQFKAVLLKAKAVGHTHCQLMTIGNFDSYVSIESALVKGWNESIHGLVTGYPVYSNYNRYSYDPVVTDVSSEEQVDRSFSKFLNS